MDAAGNLYVTDTANDRVVKLAAGSATPTELPFTGLNNPGGVAVDAASNVYVTDNGNNRVVKLAAVMRRTAGAQGRRASPTEAPLRVRKQHEGRARGARLSGRV